MTDEERWIAATEAARLLGQPKMARTLMRRAEEAHTRGDARVQRVGRYWCAPMTFWREVRHLRPAGRPPKHLTMARGR